MNKDEDITIWNCGFCDGKLIKRINKVTGEQFLGCTNYPKCKYTQPLEPEEKDIADAASVWE